MPSFSIRNLPAWFCGLGLFALTFLVYWPALSGGFLWNENDLLGGSPVIRSTNGLKTIWFTAAAPDYFPLTTTSFWLEWRLWGNNSAPYHLANVTLHALSAILLWRVLLRLRISGARLAALLFAIHPVNVESVAWIGERKNVLSLFFYLLATLFFLRGSLTDGQSSESPQPINKKRLFYSLSIMMFLLSLLSKNFGIMLPFALLLCLWWVNGRITRKDILRITPFFVVALLFGIVALTLQSRVIGDSGVVSPGILSRVANVGIAIWFYFLKALLPVHLSFVYGSWKIHALLGFLPLLALIAALFFFWSFRATWGRAALFAAAYFGITLFPVLGFFDFSSQSISPVADRWQYFALIGLMPLIAVGLQKLKQGTTLIDLFPQRLLKIALMIAIACAGWHQCSFYKNSTTLWRETFKRNPESWLVLNRYGLILEQEGKAIQSLELYKKSLELQPKQVEARNALASLLLGAGKTQDATDHLQMALKLDPASAVTHYNIGNTLGQQGKQAEAIAEYNEALLLNPDYADAHNNLACHLAMTGKLDEASKHLRRAVELRPDYPDALSNLGSLLLDLKKTDEAISFLEKAVKLNSNHADAQFNLANALSMKGKNEMAIEHYAAALRLNPMLTMAHYRLANLIMHAGKREEAITHYNAALEQNPDLAEVHYQLGVALNQTGKASDAGKHWQKALELKPNWLEPLNNLAWLYATDKNPLNRDGDEAVKLAKRAAELTQFKDAGVLDTLAASYAQKREFDKAIATAQQAIGIAEGQQATNLLNQITSHLKFYQGREPYREK